MGFNAHRNLIRLISDVGKRGWGGVGVVGEGGGGEGGGRVPHLRRSFLDRQTRNRPPPEQQIRCFNRLQATKLTKAVHKTAFENIRCRILTNSQRLSTKQPSRTVNISSDSLHSFQDVIVIHLAFWVTRSRKWATTRPPRCLP